MAKESDPKDISGTILIFLIIGGLVGYWIKPDYTHPREYNSIDSIYTGDSIYYIRFYIDSVKENTEVPSDY